MLTYLELFFGKSFTGKTARMLHEVRAEPRLVIADPKCAQLVNLRGYAHVWPDYIPGKHGGWVGNANNPAHFFRKHRSGDFRVVIHFRAYFREQLELLCMLVRHVGHLTLAVDELGLFIPAGAASALPPAITAAMISGRHEGLKFCGTAQIPSLVHFVARSNASRMRWFRTTEKNSLIAAEAYMPREFVTSLPSLPDYVCVDTTDGAPAFRDESMVGKLKILTAQRSR